MSDEETLETQPEELEATEASEPGDTEGSGELAEPEETPEEPLEV